MRWSEEKLEEYQQRQVGFKIQGTKSPRGEVFIAEPDQGGAPVHQKGVQGKSEHSTTKQPAQKKKTKNNPALPVANLEHAASSEPLGTEENKGLASRCNVFVKSFRKRLVDPDGISIKACLDGIVHRKLLPDDNSKIIKEIRYTQEQASEDETVILIEWGF